MLFSKSFRLIVAGLIGVFSSISFSQTIAFTHVNSGYVAGSIDLPLPFTGSLAADPSTDRLVYVSLGNYGNSRIGKLDLQTGQTNIVNEGSFSSIGGMTVLSATQILVVDNHWQTGGIYLIEDLNEDGVFAASGEVRSLISPILTGSFGWTGAQARVVPAGNPSGIPSGSVLIQTADGNGEGELLVITDPLGTPAFRPVGGAFFTGFDYNGGFDFDSQGRIIMGTLTGVFNGNVFVLDNLNADQVIDSPAESTRIISGSGLPFGMADLAIDHEEDVFLASGSNLYSFKVPSLPVQDGIQPELFASTNAGFLSGVVINTRSKGFELDSGSNSAMLLVGGWVSDFSAAASNLLTIQPADPSEVENWSMY